MPGIKPENLRAILYGGPLDGAAVEWTEPVCAMYMDDPTRMAIYRRRDDGHYNFERCFPTPADLREGV